MINIFITGGTGFFGKSMFDYINNHTQIALDINFIVLSRDPDKFKRDNYELIKNISSQLTFIKGDVRSFDINSISYDIDYIIHGATDVSNALSDHDVMTSIIDGTNHILNFAKIKNIRHILFISSGAVYGKYAIPISETFICQPITTYGKSKLLAENILLSNSYGINIKIARCFSFVGKYLNRNIHYAIGNFIQNCLDNNPIVINGDGKPVRSYMHSDDLVEWLFTILFDNSINPIYNVGSPYSLSIFDLACTIKQILKSNSEIIINNTEKISNQNIYVPNVNLAINELNLSIKNDIRTSVLKSI